MRGASRTHRNHSGALVPAVRRRLVATWRTAPRRWGNRLHSLCSYMAMFPPAVPHTFVEWLTEPGDVVYDPFSGRGTTPLEACLMGRTGLGSDMNPLAWVLTSAKVSPPTRRALDTRLAELRAGIAAMSIADEPRHVKMLFSRKTLAQLLWLREELDERRGVDRFILAVLLGMLHANADISGRPRGLTVAMPNTFSMSPLYVERYIRDHGLEPPRVDVLDVLEARLATIELPNRREFQRGEAWMQDATAATAPPAGMRANLIFTSPPYLRVILYGKFNWLRLWLLGRERKPVDKQLFTSSSLDRYLEFMTKVIRAMRVRVRNDGFACLVIGDVAHGDRELKLAKEVERHCVPGSGFTSLGVIADRLPVQHKVSRIWGETKGQATRTDRVLVLAAPRAREPGPVPHITW